MIARASYRVRQALSSIGAGMRPDDWELVEGYLSPAERALFARMQSADQRHSVKVLRSLLREGVADLCLLKAALLHDVGKSRCRLGLVHRTVAVLLQALLGDLQNRLVRWPPGRRWLPFYVIANHSRIGAGMLATAGTAERVWRLVEFHQLEATQLGEVADGEWVRWALEALRRADNEH